MAQQFGMGDFLGRLLFALILVFASYNPSGYSWLSWATAEGTTFNPYLALSAVVLVIGWVIYLRATFVSLGVIGISLGAALFGCLVWLLIDLGWITLESTDAMAWVGLILMSFLLALGMSWSHIRRKLSGQYDLAEGDED